MISRDSLPYVRVTSHPSVFPSAAFVEKIFQYNKIKRSIQSERKPIRSGGATSLYAVCV